MFCSKCGVENQVGSKFCGGCGAAISATELPLANSAPLVADKDLEMFVGKNYSYYKKMWGISEGGNKKLSFNLAAFLVSVFWMAYRKMYFNASMLLAITSSVALLSYFFNIPSGWSGAFSLLVAFVCGFAGNHLYKSHAERKIKTITATQLNQDNNNELSTQGGTNGWAMAGFVLIYIMLGMTLGLLMRSDPVKQELAKYSNEILKTDTSRKEFASALLVAQRTENYDDMVQSWSKCSAYMADLQKIAGGLQTEEVKTVHDLLIKSTTKTCEALAAVAEGIGNENIVLMSQGATQIIDAAKLRGQWKTQLLDIAAKHKTSLPIVSINDQSNDGNNLTVSPAIASSTTVVSTKDCDVTGNKLWYEYEPTVVTLKGKLISAKGETPDEKEVSYPALQLDSPISIRGNGESNNPETGVTIIQLALNKQLWPVYESSKGTSVTVTGTLFQRSSPYHYAKVLITATQLVNSKPLCP
ncbi:MAG: DUF2628 domain-containing protein [Sideroxydans sp.]|nr:DUF2628 domain-containing protein [Sideroxydans sp.]